MSRVIISSDPVSEVLKRLSTSKNPQLVYPAIDKLSQEDYQRVLSELEKAYHEKPLIPDQVYDFLEGKYEARYGKPQVKAPPCIKPELKKKARSKAKADGPKRDIIQKVKLPRPMWSLDKVKDEHALGLYKRRFPECKTFISTHKLDGNSAYIDYTASGPRLYKHGAEDEWEGTDISFLLDYISYPKSPPIGFAARAELVIPLRVFEEKYKKRAPPEGEEDSLDDEGMANTRNMVSGITNSKSLEPDKLRDIHLVAYEAFTKAPLPKSAQLELLKSYGFETAPQATLALGDLTVENLTLTTKAAKEASAYDLDGIVLAADLPLPSPLDRNPRHIIAFKIAGETGIARVKKVEWNISKHGLFKPRVNYEPVHLGGVTIEWSSGYNARWIVDSGIGPGAQLILTRSGDVIPKPETILVKTEPQMPDEPYEWLENEQGEQVEIAVPKGSIRHEQKIKQIVAFFKELGAKLLAKTTIKKLYEGGLNTLVSLFEASEEDIIEIDGFQARSAERLVASIQGAIREAPLYKVMAASCLFPGFGSKRLRQICTQFPGIEKLDDPGDLDEVKARLLTIGGFFRLADVFVANLLEFNEWLAEHPQIVLADPEIDDTDASEEDSEEKTAPSPKKGQKSKDIPLAESSNFPIEKEVKALQISDQTSKSLKNQTIVFTGTRADLQLQRAIEKRGGRITSGVSGKTTLVIVKDLEAKISGKIKDAQDRGIPVLPLAIFLQDYNLA